MLRLPDFNYVRPRTLREATKILADLGADAMIVAGGTDVYLHDDEWSISTIDGSLSAHFEHTVAITHDGPKILTVTPNPAETVLLP